MRKERFYCQRMRKARELFKPRIRKELDKHEELVKGPVVPKRRALQSQEHVADMMDLESIAHPTMLLASKQKISSSVKVKKPMKIRTVANTVDEDIQM